MAPVLQWIVAIVAGGVVAALGVFYVRTALRRKDETAAGIAVLAAMSWRPFLHLVFDALSRRGFRRVVDHENASGDTDHTLQKDGQQYLLACKHGSAFVLSHPAVQELADDIRLTNAQGGFLVTQGGIDVDVRPMAERHGIELLDGPALWPQVRELVPASDRAAIQAQADQKARQRSLFAGLIGLVAAVAIYGLLPSSTEGRQPAAPAVSAAEATPPVAHTLPGEPPHDAPKEMPMANTEEALQRQRRDIAQAVSTLAMVDRAVWSTSSTLQVFLLETKTDPVKGVCQLVERYPSLASSRIQFTPPQGSEERTRFLQCRSY